MTGDRTRAEDLAQEAFLKLLGRFGHLRKPESFRAYLLRTVTNLAKNEYRAKAAVSLPPQGLAESDFSSQLLERDELIRALRLLPHRQQVSVVLRYCVDLTEQQTADAMGTSVKAVKALVKRGLTRLREHGEITR
jgi:RNA polymerase sigma factor (sigma-70 family)